MDQELSLFPILYFVAAMVRQGLMGASCYFFAGPDNLVPLVSRI